MNHNPQKKMSQLSQMNKYKIEQEKDTMRCYQKLHYYRRCIMIIRSNICKLRMKSNKLLERIWLRVINLFSVKMYLFWNLGNIKFREGNPCSKE